MPALILFVGALVLPETPSSLVERGHVERGRHILKRLRGTEDVDAELSDIRTAVAAASAIKNEWTAIFKRRYSPQLVISILVPCFQQWTGINAIMCVRCVCATCMTRRFTAVRCELAREFAWHV